MMKLAALFILGLSLLAIASAGIIDELQAAVQSVIDDGRAAFENIALQFPTAFTEELNNLVACETALVTTLVNAISSGQIGL